jgi:hypothetical protein
MRTWLGVFAGMLGLAVATAGTAGEYRSGFGFAISVPDVYLVLTQREVAAQSDLLLGENEASVLDSIPADLREVVLQRIMRGDLEIFYRREGLSGDFIDNVNVMRQPSPLPKSAEQVESLCSALPAEFSRVFGRPIAVDACEIRNMMGRRALYLQFDGAIVGTKTLQYQLEQAAGSTLVMTATAASTNLSRMLGEFEAMVASIRPN